MKPSKWIVVLLAFAAAAVTASSAFAHGRSRVFVGFGFGVPLWPAPYYSPYYYPAPVYYPAPYVASPPVYVERSDVSAAPAQSAGDWFYCAESRGYYPYVQQCPGQWQRVPAAPPPGKP